MSETPEESDDTQNKDTHPIQTPVAFQEDKTMLEFVNDVVAAVQGPTGDDSDTDLRLHEINLSFVDKDGEEYVYTQEATDVDFSTVNNLEPVDLPIQGLDNIEDDSKGSTNVTMDKPTHRHNRSQRPRTAPKQTPQTPLSHTANANNRGIPR